MSVLDRAFSRDEGLRSRISAAINATPQYAPLFEEIAVYHLAHSQQPAVNGTETERELAEPASKKRKLLNGSLPIGNSHGQPRHVIFEASDISFSLPQRKKLHLGIVQYGQDAKSSSTSYAICIRNPTTGDVEVEIPLSVFAYALRLPVPEKAQKQYNFCLLPKTDGDATVAQPLIWTINHGPLKSFQISSPDLEKIASGPDDVLEQALDFALQKTRITLIYPDEKEFASATPEAHRKGEKAYHVKAFRGSKEGFLFFLQTGIFFGFKKPLAFFAFDEIDSISYTSVLQRTFNLNIAYKETADGEIQEVEFSMIDQADFAGIDAYIKRHQLQDASMAEARRAKKAKAATKPTQIDASEEVDERTELQKAEAEIEDEEDEEDEEEEDYDPGDDGDSDGSGSSSEEEDEYAEDHGEDLVHDELGSEAEDVEPDPEDNDQL